MSELQKILIILLDLILTAIYDATQKTSIHETEQLNQLRVYVQKLTKRNNIVEKTTNRVPINFKNYTTD